MKVDPRFIAGEGVEVFNGNELLIKGCLEVEGGVHLMTGYPGSPVAGFFDILGDIGPLLQKQGVRAFQANNEALGAAAVNGAQMVGCRAVVTFKSVGTHVASDALALGNLAGAHPHGGVVVISGDDPWCDSTQVPADCRFLFEHLRMAVVEPGDSQELKDWIDLSFKLSQAAGVYIGYVVTTTIADGGGTVRVHANQFPQVNTRQRMALDTSTIDLDKVLLPPRTWQHEVAMPDRLAKTVVRARELGLNQIFPATRGAFATAGAGAAGASSAPAGADTAGADTAGADTAGADTAGETRAGGMRAGQGPGSADGAAEGAFTASATASGAAARPAPLGFITTGMGRSYLEHVLSDVGLLGHFPILNMGMPYPVDTQLVAEFSASCDDMIVIEERRSFLEKNIRDRAFQELPHAQAADIVRRLYGKQFPARAGTGNAASDDARPATGDVRPATEDVRRATAARAGAANSSHDSLAPTADRIVAAEAAAEANGHPAAGDRAAEHPASENPASENRTAGDHAAVGDRGVSKGPAADRSKPDRPATTPGIPETRGLNPSVLAQLLIPLLQRTWQLPAHLRNGRLTGVLDLIRSTQKRRLEVLGRSITDDIVPRTPTFCPGCPHRDSSAALLEMRKNFADPKYMQQHHGRDTVDLIAHGDTGCYTMLMFAPTEQLMHNYSGMGLGGGTGTGVDPFVTNKQIVFMGDGTFFHSGQVAISNAIKAGQDICFIILENKTTAMTGHQEHAGTELDVVGNRSYIQDIEAIVRGMAGTSPLSVEKLSPANRDLYKKTLESTILRDGVKVIIADKECGITYNRTQLKEERKQIKDKGFLPVKWHMNVTEEVCEHCLECTKATACPGLTVKETDYGPKVDTDLTWCTNDGACERVRTSNNYGTSVKPCPSFEQVKIVRKHRKRYTLPNMELSKLPEAQPVHAMTKPGSTWRVHMAGVGGMGIGVVSAILVRAGHKEGYKVVFCDKKGLAIRNGGVYSQITYVKEQPAVQEQPAAVPEAQGRSAAGKIDDAGGIQDTPPIQHAAGVRDTAGVKDAGGLEDTQRAQAALSDPASPAQPPAERPDAASHANATATTGIIPYGQADLLLGIDILEAARAIDPREQFRVAHKNRTAAVLNTHKQATVNLLLGKQDFDPQKLREDIFEHCVPDQSFAKNLSQLCEERLGSKQFVNIMMLGVAYQLGLIPVSPHSIAWAIKDTVRRGSRQNMKAFNIGRKLALEPRAIPSRPEARTWQQVLTQKTKVLRKSSRRGNAHAEQLEAMVNGAITQMPELPAQTQYDLAVRTYDLLQYQNADYAKRYLELVRGIYRRDAARSAYGATHAAVWNVAKVMLIKDEPYVAYLLTRYEKKVRDHAKFNIDESVGDKIIYRHHTSPEFNVGKHRIRLKITTTDWMLQIVRHMKWWRKLPGWHAREVNFREWYIGLLDKVDLSHAAAYDQALRVLKTPEPVEGYREVRYPKIDAARQVVDAELANKPTLEASINRDALRRPAKETVGV